MHKVLREFEEQKLRVSVEYYDNEIYQLQTRKAESRESIGEQVEIMNSGWKAFEDGRNLVMNPYVFVDEPDKFSWWREGWKMANKEDYND